MHILADWNVVLWVNYHAAFSGYDTAQVLRDEEELCRPGGHDVNGHTGGKSAVESQHHPRAARRELRPLQPRRSR